MTCQLLLSWELRHLLVFTLEAVQLVNAAADFFTKV
jgi:hypothetical protein